METTLAGKLKFEFASYVLLRDTFICKSLLSSLSRGPASGNHHICLIHIPTIITNSTYLIQPCSWRSSVHYSSFNLLKNTKQMWLGYMASWTLLTINTPTVKIKSFFYLTHIVLHPYMTKQHGAKECGNKPPAIFSFPLPSSTFHIN